MTELYPIDLMGHYLAASEGVGPVMSLDAIDRRLATWPVGPTVWILSQLCRRVDLLRPNETAAQVALCHELFPPGTAAKAELRVREGGAVVISSQVVANLTLRALVHCKDDSDSVVSEAHIASNVGHLLLAVGDHLGSTEDTREGMALEITRLGLFYSQHDVAVWLQLGAELFFDVMPSMSGHHQFVDVDSVVQIAHGMSARRFWSLTVVQGLALRQDVGLLEVPAKMKEWNATTTDLDAWVSAWSSPLDRCRDLATTDISGAQSNRSRKDSIWGPN